MLVWFSFFFSVGFVGLPLEWLKIRNSDASLIFIINSLFLIYIQFFGAVFWAFMIFCHISVGRV